MLAVALLFLMAGSLWTHFGLGVVFLQLPLIAAWMLIHALGFLNLRFARLEVPLTVLGLGALQLYFQLILKTYQAPFLPLAPVFFVVSALSLAGYANGRLPKTLLIWGVAWLSSLAWLLVGDDVNPQSRKAFAFAFTLNTGFLGAFWLVTRTVGRRLARDLVALGPSRSFDDQRLQAAKLQVLGELTASLAHEISNPLTAIAGYNYQVSEELKDNPTSPSLDILRQATERVQFNVQRITEITKTVRSFARDASAEDFRPVSVKELFADTLLLMRHPLKAAGVEVTTTMPAGDCFVRGNFVQLSQVLVNFLSNARDACRDAEIRRVNLGCSVERGQVFLWAEDTGSGVSEGHASRLFQPFFTTKERGRGTGLGLYISRLIAERHGAELGFENLKDSRGKVSGSRFYLKLELTNAKPAVDGKAA